MSAKVVSLGVVGAVANGLTVTGATNATPIVISGLPTNHGLKAGDRIAISGITGNTNANGEWTLSNITANGATLVGSAGNGVFGGTAVVSNLMDTTPHMKGHSARVDLTAYGVGVATAPVLTGLIESSDDGVTFADAKIGVAVPAITTANTWTFEVFLKKYMRLRASAYTSGSASATITA